MKKLSSVPIRFGACLLLAVLLVAHSKATTTQNWGSGEECNSPSAGAPCPDCPPVGGGQGPKSESSVGPQTALTENPIHLRQGAVYEQATDIRIPTGMPGVTWRWNRTYQSTVDTRDLSGQYGEWLLGNRWNHGRSQMALLDYVPSGIEGDYLLRMGAGAFVPFVETGSDTGIYRSRHVAMTLREVDRTINGEVYSMFELVDDATGELFEFWGFGNSVNGAWRGKLREQTTVERKAKLLAGDPSMEGILYNYENGSSRVSSIVLPSPANGAAAYEIAFYPHQGSGLGAYLGRMEVWNGPANDANSVLLTKVEYFYHNGSADSHLGERHDLLGVKVTKLNSDSSSLTATNEVNDVRFTHYRYFDGSVRGKLKAVYEPDVVDRICSLGLAEQNSVISSPEDLLAAEATDSHIVNSTSLTDYASRSFTYYGNDFSTDSVATAWGTENLNTTYDAVEAEESHNYLVKSETVRGSCQGCGGSGAGFTKTYYYLYPDGEPEAGYEYHLYSKHAGAGLSDVNQVTFLIVEDTVAADGSEKYRTIYGVNDHGMKLREVKTDDPIGANGKYWCKSWVYSKVGTPAQDRLAEFRSPAAHNVTKANVARFLNPYGSYPNQSGKGTSEFPGWINDNATLQDDQGQILVHSYNADGYRTSTRVKNGRKGDADPTTTPNDDTADLFYVSACDYDYAGDPSQIRRAMVTDKHVYPEKVIKRAHTSRLTTQYKYTFHTGTGVDPDAISSIETILPAVAQNGPNEPVSTFEYFDQEGKLRWTVDGEGFVNYYAYDPVFGNLAYKVKDVDPAALPTGNARPANDTYNRWISPSDGSPATPTRTAKYQDDSTVPAPLELIESWEFDALGRTILHVDAGEHQHYRAYASDKDATYPTMVHIDFPYWDGTQSATPINVTPVHNVKIDTTGTATPYFESYQVDPQPTAVSVVTQATPTGTRPVGFSTTPPLASRVSQQVTRLDRIAGWPAVRRRYYDIVGNGYYSTAYLHDALGRTTATVAEVAPQQYQVTAQLFDFLGRPTKKLIGRHSSLLSSYVQLFTNNDPAQGPASYLALVGETTYDNDQVGDGFVTSRNDYYQVGSCITSTFYRTFRGVLRGTHRVNGSNEVKPFLVQDVDWLGRVTASAKYTAFSAWTTLTANGGYDTYVATNPTNRHFLSKNLYDQQQRLYRREVFPGIEPTKHTEINNYYDRRGNLVATGDKYGAQSERAYDGAGRMYQQRTVTDVSSTTYSTEGRFNYRLPFPNARFGRENSTAMTGGNQGVIELSHSLLDAMGNTLEQHTLEANHNDSDGLNMSGTDYVRQSAYSWYDTANRLIATATWGAGLDGDANSANDTWKFTSLTNLPIRSSIDPRPILFGGLSTILGSNSERLTTNILYNESTARQEIMYDSASMPTKTFYDDLGRRIETRENYFGEVGPTTWDQNRQTIWSYNGLDHVTTLTANTHSFSPSTAQVTTYEYGDSYHASLVTKTIYPDGDTSTDNVQTTYHLDGSINTRKDQRGVVLTYSYDSARRTTLQAATATGGLDSKGVDDGVESIGRGYDDLGRVETITSYAGTTTGSTILNQLQYTYDSYGLLTKTQQSHSSAVTTGTLSVDYTYDISDSSGVLTNRLRLEKVTYPSGRVVFHDYGSSNSMADRLSQIAQLRETSAAGPLLTGYQYNGTSRLASVDLAPISVRRNMYGSTPSDYARWDRFGRTTTHQWDDYSGSPTAVDQFDYTYDTAGNRLTRNNRVASGSGNVWDQDYEYDGLHRLKDVDQGTASDSTHLVTTKKFEQQWSLDQLGNWSTFKQDDDGTGWDLDQARDHNDVNEIDTDNDHSNAAGASITSTTGPNWADPAHDAAGNMTTIPKPKDLTNSYTAKYDAWHRLVSLKKGSNYVQLNLYDGLHRRIMRFTDTDDNGSLDGSKRFYYNEQWQCLEEQDYAGNLHQQYVWHPYYIDALAVSYNSSGDKHFYCHDANFNITAAMDSNGDVVERYHYSPYGAVTVLDADFSLDSDNVSDIGNEFLYTGRRLDPVTGLQYSRYRYYHPGLGRWVTRDPIRYLGGWNLYDYVHGMPLIYVDPLGLKQTITIMCDQPGAGGDRDPFENWTNPDVGHTFICLEDTNTGEIIVCGLYPSEGVTPWDPDASGIIIDDSGHQYDVSLTLDCTDDQYSNAKKHIEESIKNPPEYNLNSNNCTSFAIECCRKAGHPLPANQGTWPGGGGVNPGDLGQDIRPKPGATGPGNAPTGRPIPPPAGGQPPAANDDCGCKK